MSRNRQINFSNSNLNNSRRNQIPDQDYYWSEAARVPITWNQFRRSHAYNRYSAVQRRSDINTQS